MWFVALSPMYPPREESPERQPKASETLKFVLLGFAWLALAGFRFLLSRKVSVAVMGLEVAVCFWVQAWATRAALKKSSCLLIALGAFSVFLIADYFAGYLRN